MATQAAVTVSRAALMWGASAGVGTLVLLSNGESSGFFKEISKHAIHVLTKPNGSANVVAQVPHGADPSQMALADQVSMLSAEVQRLRMASYSHGSSGSSIGVGVVVAGGAAVGLVLYIKGWTLGDLMYVTKKHFVDTIEKLKQGMETLSENIEHVRADLAAKIGLVDERVEQTRLSLEQKIEQEVGNVQRDVAAVGQDVKGILSVQNQVQRVVHSLEDKFFQVDGKLDDTRHQISVATRGVMLLCNVVADGMANSGVSRHSGSRYDELLQYSKQELRDLPGNTTAMGNTGLKMLVGGESSAENGTSIRGTPLARSLSLSGSNPAHHDLRRTNSSLHSRLQAMSLFPSTGSLASTK